TKKFIKPPVIPAFKALKEALDAQQDWSDAALETTFKAILADSGLGMGKLAQPVRIALTGGPISPGIYEVLRLLGRDKALPRMAIALEEFEKIVESLNQ
ncbi:MAG: glutamate--tRNA ligase, partial [Magnetococcales bacterium]|nr:glutamate--tRNA ligase [Magnetococcales bacterium]